MHSITKTINSIGNQNASDYSVSPPTSAGPAVVHRTNKLRDELQRLHLGTFTGPAGSLRQRTELTPAVKKTLLALGPPEPRRVYEATSTDRQTALRYAKTIWPETTEPTREIAEQR
ncbi:hypothetical protein WEI85_18985 [Actinomycetes bacterium KLBMP 9797]